MRSHWYAVILASAMSQHAAAEDWLYAADLSSNVIHAISTDQLGTRRMVPISGQLALTAEQAVHLDAENVVFVPLATRKLVHLHIPTGAMTQIAEFGAPGLSLARLSDGSGVSLVTWDLRTRDAGRAHRFSRNESGTWGETMAPHNLLADGHVFIGDSWYVMVYERYETDTGFTTGTRIHRLQQDGTQSVAATLTGQYRRIQHTPQGFAVFGSGLPSKHFDSTGNPIDPLDLAPALEGADLSTISFGPEAYAQAIPATGPNAGALAVQSSGPDTVEIVPGPFTSADKPVTLVPARDLRQLASGTYAYQDSFTGGLHRLDKQTKRVSQYFMLSRGSGPVFESIQAMASGPDGLLYVLDLPYEGNRIIRVDPGTGNRTVIWSNANQPLRLRNVLHVASPTHFVLVEQADVALEYAPGGDALDPTPRGEVRRLEVRLNDGETSITRTDSFTQGLPSYATLLKSDGTIYSTSNDTLRPGIYRLMDSHVTSLLPTTPLELTAETSSPVEYRAEYSAPDDGVTYSGFVVQLDSSAFQWGPMHVPPPQATFLHRGGLRTEILLMNRFVRPEGVLDQGGVHAIGLEGSIRVSWMYLGSELSPYVSAYATQLGDTQFLVPRSPTNTQSPLAVRYLGRGLYRLSDDLSAVEATIPIVPENFQIEELHRQATAFFVEAENALYIVGFDDWALYRVDPDTGSATRAGNLLPDAVDLELSGHSTSPGLVVTLAPAPVIPPTGWQLQ